MILALLIAWKASLLSAPSARQLGQNGSSPESASQLKKSKLKTTKTMKKDFGIRKISKTSTNFQRFLNMPETHIRRRCVPRQKRQCEQT